MLDSGRQVEEIARQRDVLLAGDAPPAPPAGLQQEDVVGIDVRTDAAARCGVAHHHVVQARLRNEGEAAQQRFGGRHMQIDAAHQERRAGFSYCRFFKGPVPRFPALATAFHDPGFDIIARCERRERALVDPAGEAGESLRDK